MATDKETRNALLNAKIRQAACLSAVFIYIIILIRLHDGDFEHPFSDDPFLTVVTAACSVVAAIGIAFGYILPWIVKRYGPESGLPAGPLATVQLIRPALFGSVAICGLVLGIMGAGWHITLPFFVVSAGLLVYTFPTEKRWKKMME